MEVLKRFRDPQRARLAKLIRSDYDYHRPKRGDVVEAVVLSIGERDIVVDLGAKRDAIVPPEDLELLDAEYVAGVQVGDHIPVVVMKTWGRSDGIRVSLNMGLGQRNWLRAQDLLDGGKVVEAEVSEINRGGAIVQLDGLRGFVPNSHLTSIARGLKGESLREAKSQLIGQTLSLAVIEVDQRRRRLVLSERVANRRTRQQLLDELTPGETLTGTVANIVDFGAFVDLGGMDGLVHVSELDWTHVEHPSDVLNVGDEVEVYVVEVDRERKRISLSRKRLLPDPWDEVTETLRRGQTVHGTVTTVTSFGFFVEVGEGLEGLVHTNETPRGPVTLMDVSSGTPVTVQVLGIDDRQRRIALRLTSVDNGRSGLEVASDEAVPENVGVLA
jgi:small subunit ribosomal protein S1